MSVAMRIEYTGKLHCRAEHGPSSSTVETDAPKDNAGQGETFSPSDLVATALATCAITTMAIKGPKEGLAFGVSSATVVKEMTASPPRRIARLSLEIQMPAGLDAGARTRMEEIARNCPVALSLSGDLKLPMLFSYPD